MNKKVASSLTNETNNAVQAEQDRLKKAVLDELARLGGQQQQEDALVFQGKKFVIPATYLGDVLGAAKFLKDYNQQQEQPYDISRVFKYRPYDVAHAFQAVLKDIWGSTGFGKTIRTFFGDYNPEFRTIDVGVGLTTQVPWGQVQLPALEAVFSIGGKRDLEHGLLGAITVSLPRKFRGHVEGLFTAIEEKLKTDSIYRGKVIDGAKDPGFINPWLTDRTKVVYSDSVLTQLEANVWGPITHTEETRALGLPLKRTVLLYGPYGTGKTLAATLTAQVTEKNGWTFVQCRAGQDDLQETLRTARLYAPAVVFFEDIDVIANNGDPDAVTRLLDMFDGMVAKGAELLVMLTTNHIDRIQKGMLRPGRLDAVIEIAHLDRQGYEKLVRSVIPAQHLGQVDFDAVAKAYDGFLPSFAKEATDRALRYNLARQGGKAGILETEDFVAAAQGLRPQLGLMEEATEGEQLPTLDKVIRHLASLGAVAGVNGMRVEDSDGDARYAITNEKDKELL